MELKNVSKSFNRTLFNGVSLKINRGILEFNGPSGCGKSTLINIILGIETPDTGEVIFNKDKVVFSYCGQDNSLFYDYSLEKNLKIYDIKIDNFAKKVIKDFNFNKFFSKKILYLSGGERRKAEIIFSLLKKSNIYIFDEPFSSLDENSKNIMGDYINEISKDHLVILVNHDENIDNLNISLRVNFDGLGNHNIEYLNFNDSNLESDNSVIIEKKINYFFLTFRSYLKRNKLDVILRFVLSSILITFFALTIVTLYRIESDETNISLQNDPFTYQRYLTTNKESINSDLFNFIEINDDKSYQYLLLNGMDKLGEDYQYTEVMFIGLLDDDVKDFYVFHKEDTQYNLLDNLSNTNQTNSAKPILVAGENTYNLNQISIDEAKKVTEDKQDIFLKSYLDDEDTRTGLFDQYELERFNIVLCNDKFIDEVILQTPELTYATISSNKLNNLNERNSINFSYIDPLITTYLNKIKVINNNSNEFYFATNGLNIGEEYKFEYETTDFLADNTVEYIKVTDNLKDSTSSKKFVMNLSQYKDLMWHSNYCEPMLKYSYGYSFDKELYLDVQKYYDFEVLDIIRPFNMENSYLNYIYLIIFSIFTLSYMIFTLVSFKGKIKWAYSIKNTLLHNQVKKKSVLIYFLSFNFIEIFIQNVVVLFTYIFYMIPYYNTTILGIYKEVNSYSQLPYNSFYENINFPIKFIHFQSIYLLIIFSFIIVSLLLGFYLYKKTNKKI